VSSPQNIKLCIAYDGTAYSGWQRQTNGRTIQGMVEEKLAVITRTEVTVNGAGRTDAGVHALGMAANFSTSAQMSAAEFQRALNSMLPTDIRILDARVAAPSFHARFDARGKTYRYDFFTGPVQPPHERLYRNHLRTPFSLDLVLPCLDMLSGSHDFTSFEAAGSRDPSRPGSRGSVRTIFHATCTAESERPGYFSLILQGDGFLRHMVRNIAGTLFLVGAGRMTPAEFQAVIDGRDRSLAGPTAPAHGLFLQQVHYAPLAATAPEY
jgi:tRNA pseudouridine38-40 synthase